MEIYGRQGDLVIDKLAVPITGELEPVRNLSLAGDSSGHRHVLRGEALVRRDGRSTLARLSQSTILTHEKPDGHEDVPIEAGDYEIRPLRERGDQGDRPVED